MSDAAQSSVGAISYEFGFDINRLLARVVRRLRERGVALAGAVQDNAAAEAGGPADMSLIDVRTERAVGISQALGRHAEGCRLDGRGLADMGESISRAIASGPGLVVLNKFGKAESEGGGLSSCFAEAFAAGIPLLTTVRVPYLEAWQAFHGGEAVDLPPDEAAVLAWCEAVTGVGLEDRPSGAEG